jgi:signal transduction histidine kinase
MKALRNPVGLWDWRGTGLVLVLMLAPLLATLTLMPDDTILTSASNARGILVGTATLAAGVFLYLHWRITGNDTSGWLALLLAIAAIPGLALGAFSPVRVVVLVGLAGTLAFTVFRLQGFPRWARARAASGMLLLGVGSAVDGGFALTIGVVGGVLLAGTAAAVLNQAINDEKRQVEELHLQLRTVETGIRDDRARLHEIDATVAGIVSAQRLISDGMAADRTDALAAMMRAEVERLQRLISDRAPTRRRSVDLDEVVGQIVLSHLARGRIVIWEPSGLRALGRADDIAEVVNVLLENAAVHGGPDAVSVRIARDFDGITVSVSDQGPGIAPRLREQLFDWGVSRPGSPGQGIGLHIAADITQELGGRLELVPTVRGATFALHLPAAPQEVRADERVARAS